MTATVGPLQGPGVGPEMAREMKLKTVTSVWECSTSAPVQGNACHKLPHQITLHCQDWKPSASEQRLKRKGGLLAPHIEASRITK